MTLCFPHALFFYVYVFTCSRVSLCVAFFAEGLYEKLLDQGHCGDRVFYTDGSTHTISYVQGSLDGVCKGGGQARELVETFGFREKVVVLKSGFDGGKTLTKHDCFPEEDPAKWVTRDEAKWSGEFRADEAGKGSEAW